MSDAITVPNAYALTVPADLAAVREYVDESLSASTRRAYRAGLTVFRAWCESESVNALPASPETVAAFLSAGADEGRKVATLEQRLAAIRWAHEAGGQESPTASKLVRSTMQGIRREQGTAPNRKAPATVDRLAARTLAPSSEIVTNSCMRFSLGDCYRVELASRGRRV